MSLSYLDEYIKGRWDKRFENKHLPEPLRTISSYIQEVYVKIKHRPWEIENMDDVIAGLRKLCEAKDCFVRAAVPFGIDEKD